MDRKQLNETLMKLLFQNGKNEMVNATEMAKLFRKHPKDWLRLPSAKRFLKTLEETKGIPQAKAVITKKGFGKEAGTWMCPNVAIEFSKWLSLDFKIYLYTTYGSSINIADFFKKDYIVDNNKIHI